MTINMTLLTITTLRIMIQHNETQYDIYHNDKQHYNLRMMKHSIKTLSLLTLKQFISEYKGTLH